jgi:hypothetical protein
MNTLHVGSKTPDASQLNPEAGLVIEEGGSNQGLEIRHKNDVPEGNSFSVKSIGRSGSGKVVGHMVSISSMRIWISTVCCLE